MKKAHELTLRELTLHPDRRVYTKAFELMHLMETELYACSYQKETGIQLVRTDERQPS